MAKRPIVTWPHPVLKRRCDDVEHFDDDLGLLLDDMLETMEDADGLGLAANQVAVSKRVFIMGILVEGEEEPELVEVVNPVIEARRGETKHEEGCLSFPDLFEQVSRAAEIDVSFRDRDGKETRETYSGLSAVCFQHELDHLDGITFIERLSPLKKRLAMRAYQRLQRQREADALEEQRASVLGSR